MARAGRWQSFAVTYRVLLVGGGEIQLATGFAVWTDGSKLSNEERHASLCDSDGKFET